MTACTWSCLDDSGEPADHPPVRDDIGFRWDYDPISDEWVSAEGHMSFPWDTALTVAGGFREITPEQEESAA